MSNREYQNTLLSNSGKFKMKNSFKHEDDNKEKVDSNESCADSLPIHCIIETMSSIGDIKTTFQHYNLKNDTENCWECNGKIIEKSDCVPVSEATIMNDLVKTVLIKLGYPSCASAFAVGYILIRNWKPLPLETICPGLKKTVGDILGELTAVITLKIQIFWPELTTLQKIKDNLLHFLIKANENFLRESGCPFETSTLSKFCEQSNCMRKNSFQEPSEDLQQKFETWLRHLLETEKELDNHKNQVQQSSPLSNSSINNKSSKKCTENMNGNKSTSPVVHRGEPNKLESCDKYLKGLSGEENYIKETSSVNNTFDRAKHFGTAKTRIRTSFDPEYELPKLHKWYLENPHPSRQQIYEYVTELNSLESRKGRKQLDVNNVVYWFKNARAAQKRSECRRYSNVTTTVTNRGNVIKIPLRKSSGVASDDQRSLSDDEGSITSESGDEYSNGNGNTNGRCLQVVGKWNSNGQGEAVLEMQIASRKNEFVQSIMGKKREQVESDGIKKMNEDDSDTNRRDSSDKKNSEGGVSEKNEFQKENQAINTLETNTGELRNHRETDTEQKQNSDDAKEDEVSSSKAQTKGSLTSYKNNGINNNLYKSGFPVTPTSILGHSFLCMSQYMNSKPNNLPLSSEERRKRNRTFIDPVTEVPRLEQWFRLSTHPSHSLITRYTEELNNMPYRRKFPKLETKNVQFWFKNRRAKNKRLNYLDSNN